MLNMHILNTMTSSECMSILHPNNNNNNVIEKNKSTNGIWRVKVTCELRLE